MEEGLRAETQSFIFNLNLRYKEFVGYGEVLFFCLFFGSFGRGKEWF